MEILDKNDVYYIMENLSELDMVMTRVSRDIIRIIPSLEAKDKQITLLEEQLRVLRSLVPKEFFERLSQITPIEPIQNPFIEKTKD